MTILVSIILTCYKQERFIDETILSVINQSFSDWELLIWDDSPNDECWCIISKYTKKYPDKIKAWHHNPNKWIVDNMTFLLNQRNKKSEYIAFLEWDDRMYPDYLEKKISIFNKYPSTWLVYNELTTIDEKWRVTEPNYIKQYVKTFYKKGKMSYNKLVSETIYMSWSSLMVRSNIVDKYGLVCSFLWKENIISDIYFFNQVAHKEDIYWIESPLIYYRIQNDSTSKSINGGIKYFLQLIEYYSFLFNKWDISENIYKKWIHRRYFLIFTRSLKQCLMLWTFQTIKLFIAESFVAMKIAIKKLI